MWSAGIKNKGKGETMKQKRFLSAVLTGAMTVMLFAGCGSNTQADTRAENTVSEQRGNRSAYGIFAWIWSVKNGMDDNTGWKGRLV